MYNITSFDEESYPLNYSISEIKDSVYNINISNTIKYPLFDDNHPFEEENLQDPINNIKLFNYKKIMEKSTNIQTNQKELFYSKDDIIDKIQNEKIRNKLKNFELDFSFLSKKKKKRRK